MSSGKGRRKTRWRKRDAEGEEERVVVSREESRVWETRHVNNERIWKRERNGFGERGR